MLFAKTLLVEFEFLQSSVFLWIKNVRA